MWPFLKIPCVRARALGVKFPLGGQAHFRSCGLLGSQESRYRRKREKAQAVLVMVRRLVSNIDSYIVRLEERERQLFEKLVGTISGGDNVRANILASEISQVRNVLRHLNALRYVVEGIALRLENSLAVGDALSSIGPAVAALRELRSIYKGLMPSMDLEIQVVESSLRELATEGMTQPGSFESTVYYNYSAEARKILEEAYAAAEKRIRENLPKPPDSQKIGGR